MESENRHPDPPPPGQDLNQPPPEQNPNPPPPGQNLNPPPPAQNPNPPPPQNPNPPPPAQNPNPPPPGQNLNPPPPGQNLNPPPPGQNHYPPPPGQNPNPPPPGQNPSYPPADSYPSHFQYYPHQNPNPNPNLVLQPNDPLYINPSLPAVAPPGVDPYSAYPNTHFSYAGAGSTVPYPPQQHYQTGHYSAADLQNWALEAVGHYSAADLQNWALEAVRQYGLDPTLYGGAQPATGISVAPNGTELLATANATSAWTYPTPHPNGNTRNKLPPKKNKVLQSVYCGICKVDCNSKEVLEKHQSGKKHKKNVEKLKQSLAPALALAPAPVPVPVPVPAPAPPVQNNVLPGSIDPVIGPPENPEKANVAGKKNSKKRAAGTEDLESRKRKVLESGAAAEAVRTCHMCNIVCNSDIVFSYHMAGKNHAAVVKRLLNRKVHE